MNRRNLLQRAAAVVTGAIAALFGIRPAKAGGNSPWAAFPFADVSLGFPKAPPIKIMLDGGTATGPLRLWLNDRFYIDLPEERYTDTVCVDWMKGEESVDGARYYAQCRVCPEFGEPWEILPMKRVND